MLRDKIKSKNYFIGIKNEGVDWLENLREMRPIITSNKLSTYYIDLDVTNNELFRICYSLGDSINSIFEYFKEGLHYYGLSYTENDGIFTTIDYLSLAVLFENRKEEFIDDVKILFDKYVQYSEEDESVQDGYIDTLALYLLEG